jgi:hypothetical protein
MRILLGVFLILAAVGLLVVMVVVPVLPGTAENTTIDRYLAQILCRPGETVVREQYTTSRRDGTGYSANIYCLNNENQRRDETGKWVIISAAAFVIPLLVGIFVLNLGRLRVHKVVFDSNIDGSSIPGVTFTQFRTGIGGASPIEGLEINEGSVKFGGMEIRVDSLTPERVQALRQQMQSVVQNGASGGNLAEKLRQLQETRDAGLISSEEYEGLRKEILDNVS